MMDAPEKATFSIERNGSEYDVDVARSAIESALGSDRLTSEAMAQWLQNNLEALSGIAAAKIDSRNAPEQRIVIAADDLRDL